MINKLIVIQPISLCNLNCSYCYVPGRQNGTVMSDEVLEASARLIFNSYVTKPQLEGEKTIVSWHAGEPLTAKIPFYEKAITAFNKYSNGLDSYVMNLQTNVTLMNQEWCDFFKSNSFHIGISVDGPESIHNFHRKDWNNKGSFSRVMRGLELMKKNGFTLNNIAVLTDHSLDYPDEMYHFFKDNNFTAVGFNIDELEGMNTASTYKNSLNHQVNLQTAQRYKSFLSRFFDLWFADGKPFYIREFDDLMSRISYYSLDDYKNFIFASECIGFSNIGITREGNIFTFSPELASGAPNDPNKFVLANVLDIESFDDIIESERFQVQMQEVSEGVKKCAKECEYFDFCGGGAPANKFYENGTFASSETMYCFITRKTLIDLMLEKLKMISAMPKITNARCSVVQNLDHFA